jgi:hypothetical protein
MALTSLVRLIFLSSSLPHLIATESEAISNPDVELTFTDASSTSFISV